MKISTKAAKVTALWIIKQNIKQKNKHSFSLETIRLCI